MVLLPGLDGTGAFFGPLLRALPQHMKTGVIDYPSLPIMSYEDLSVHAAGRFPNGPVIVLGESFSGPVATLLASQFPGRVKGLILASSFVSAPRPRWLSHFLYVPGFECLAKTFACFALLGFRHAPENAALAQKIIPALPPALIQSRVALALAADYSQVLRHCRCPMLIIHGTQDLLVPPRYVNKVAQLRADATVCRFKGPHMLLQTAPAECAAQIAAFVLKCR